MASAPLKTPLPPRVEGEPAWDIAKLFPLQGHWAEGDYLQLNGNYLVEYTHGHVEVLPMPTDEHQAIVAFLFMQLSAFVMARGLGTPRFAPLRLRVVEGKFREPDVLFLLRENDRHRRNEFWTWADLVMEVVSVDHRNRDLETKRRDYAQAGIPEYWIVDPMLQEVTVLKLAGHHYDAVGTFKPGDRATSALLPGFAVEVAEIFSAAKQK